MKRTWSLERRLTIWFTALTLALVSAIIVLSTFFVLGATAREFEAVATEEIDELRALFRDRALTHEAMADEAESLAKNHPGVRAGWRIWDPETGVEWGRFGEAHLLPPLGERPNEPWLRLREVPFGSLEGADPEGPLWIGMYVDGRGRLFPLKKFAAIAGLMLLGAGLSALLAGALFGRKTARLLERVADRVQSSEPEADTWRAQENPPVEIQRVAHALEEALQTARKEQERSAFLIAGVAHELRSPIQNLLGETEVLLMRDRSPQEYQQILLSHTEEIQDLAREIDNLVTLCAQGTNQMAQRVEAFDLREELELRLPREVSRAQRQQVRLETEWAGDLSLSGDREALLLALRNLVGNAIAFSPAGATVHISAHGSEEEVTLAVDDAGPGVAPDLREKIFEPFQVGQQAPGARTGFGLGLALAKEAIEAQGGRLRVVTSERGGARFEARIPKVRKS